MLRVAIICPLLPLRSGIAVYSHKLAMSIKNFMPVIILANQGASRFYKHYKQLKIIECWSFSSVFSFISIIRTLLRIKPNIVHLQLAYTWIKDPLITQFNTLILLFLLKLLKVKTIVTLHGVITLRTLEEFFRSSSISRLLIPFFIAIWVFFYACLAKLTDAIIVHNYLIRRALISIIGKHASHKIYVIPHGVDKAQVTIVPSEKTTINLLFIGFLRKNKGLDDLVKAFKECVRRIPNLRLTIAGPFHVGDDPKFLMNIVKMIKKHSLQKHIKIITRFLSESELNKLISTSDIIILPYKDFFYEASGVLARIMDYSKPVVCTEIPKFYAELTHGKDAIFVPPGNWKALRDSILLLSSNSHLRRKLAESLKRKAKERYWEKIAKRHIQIYLKLGTRL